MWKPWDEINFGRAIKDFKGITEKVELSYTMNTGSQVTVNLKNWQIYTLSDSYQVQKDMKYVPLKDQKVPGCYRATFNLKKTGDTFLNLEHGAKDRFT